MVGIGTAPDQRATLQRADDEVHGLRGHECPARELGTGQPSRSRNTLSVTYSAATNLNLGGAAFVPFWPDRLSGDNGPFNPFAQGSRW